MFTSTVLHRTTTSPKRLREEECLATHPPCLRKCKDKRTINGSESRPRTLVTSKHPTVRWPSYLQNGFSIAFDHGDTLSARQNM